MPDRIFTRTQRRDAPAGTGTRHEAALQRRDQPRSHQRRLAAARGADDGDEAGGPEPADERIGVGLAAEKEMLLVGLERPESGERVTQGDLP
jgi:hypothetical protein